MALVSVEELRRDLETYLSRVEAGETVVVTRNEKPVAEIKRTIVTMQEPRPFGLAAGEFTVPDDFDDPLPEEILREFEGQ